MKKQIRFIINPISGVGQKKILPNLIHTFLNHQIFSYDIVYTEYRGHAAELAKEFVSEEIDVICIAGGDGSIREVATELIYTKTSLAVLPTGSGNGIARHLGIPLKLTRVIEHINKLSYQSMDVLKINDIIGVGFVGLGYDALVAKKFDLVEKRGLKSYAKLVIKELSSFKGINLKINGIEQTDLFICTIANVSQFGNDFYLSPHSDVADGKFELVKTQKTNIFRLLYLFYLSKRKKIHKTKHVNISQHESVEIELENPLIHIDGDPFELENSKIQINILPNALNILV